MSRKDYVAIAAAIKKFTDIYDDEVSKEVVTGVSHNIANVFSDDNPRFDRSRFLQACGVE